MKILNTREGLLSAAEREWAAPFLDFARCVRDSPNSGKIAAARQRELKAGIFTHVYRFQRFNCFNFDYSLFSVVLKTIFLDILVLVAAILRQT